jgi:hypothetical protein
MSDGRVYRHRGRAGAVFAAMRSRDRPNDRANRVRYAGHANHTLFVRNAVTCSRRAGRIPGAAVEEAAG